jgi:transposase-like protein
MTGREKKQHRLYSPEQRAEAVKLVRVSGQSIRQVADDLGIPENTLWNWVSRSRIDAGEGPAGALTTDERQELVRLRRENRRLTQERDFLKKAAAFFAKQDEDLP